MQFGTRFLSVENTTLGRGSRRPKAWPGPSLGGMVFRCGEGNVLEGLKAAIWMFCLKACKGGSGFLILVGSESDVGHRQPQAEGLVWPWCLTVPKATFWRLDGCNLEA